MYNLGGPRSFIIFLLYFLVGEGYMSDDPDDLVIGMTEAAAYLGVVVSRVSTLVARGRLPTVPCPADKLVGRTGRPPSHCFRKSDLDAFKAGAPGRSKWRWPGRDEDD